MCAEAESSLSGLASDASSVMVRSTLDQVTQRSQQLQKDLADSAHLLSKYNLKSAQQVSTEAQSTTGLWYSYLCIMLLIWALATCCYVYSGQSQCDKEVAFCRGNGYWHGAYFKRQNQCNEA